MSSRKSRASAEDIEGLWERLIELDHDDILTRLQNWLRAQNQTLSTAFMQSAEANKVTGISERDFHLLVQTECVRYCEERRGGVSFPVIDLCSTIKIAAMCKRSQDPRYQWKPSADQIAA